MKKTYIITGTSRGIGLELTQQLLKAGNSVYALARDPEKSKPLTSLKTQFSDQIRIYAVDVKSDEQIAAFTKELGKNTPVDVLINNAGMYGEGADLKDISFDTTMDTFLTNTIAPMRVTRALLPNLEKSQNPKVVHITSLMGSIHDNSSGGYYGYRMSKAALNMFSKSFSIDFKKITSLVVHPGWVQTDMGGPDAPTQPHESAKGIISVIEKATLKDSGKFFDFEGDELPW
jgi:NAD(P)-dependent dehydrogenase (short-subunit alcohol dehydrogenase family)